MGSRIRVSSRLGLVAGIAALALLASPALAVADSGWDYASWGWTEPAGPRIDFRWGADLPKTTVTDRWSVEDCDGDAPFLCFTSNRGGAGKAELLLFPMSSMDDFRADAAEVGRDRALRRHAREHYRVFAEDREEGCPEPYTFHPLRIRSAKVAGRDGIRFGFVVKDGDGRVVERSNTYATATRRHFVVVGVEGLTGRACLPIEGPTFTPRQLRTFGPYVARLVANGRLPR